MQDTACIACRFVLTSLVNFTVVAFRAAQVVGSSLQPAFDNVQVFTSVLVSVDAVAKVTVPEKSAVLVAERVTVEPEKLSTVAPAATPVPVAVIPKAIPVGLPTEIVFCPDKPLAEVAMAELPPKTIVPDTAAELGVESVTVVPDTPVTVAPLATPRP